MRRVLEGSQGSNLRWQTSKMPEKPGKEIQVCVSL